MKLSTVNPELNIDIDRLLSKDVSRIIQYIMIKKNKKIKHLKL